MAPAPCRYHSCMRIAHMLLSRGFAGTERATAEMCNAHVREHALLLIIRRGHRGAGGASIRDRLDSAVQVIEVGNWWPRAAVCAALAQFAPDVVHAHLRRSTRLLARIRPDAATIATLHLTVNGPHFAAMDGLICIAAWQQRDIPRNYRGQIFFINESMIPARRDRGAARRAWRIRTGVPDRRSRTAGLQQRLRSADRSLPTRRAAHGASGDIRGGTRARAPGASGRPAGEPARLSRRREGLLPGL